MVTSRPVSGAQRSEWPVSIATSSGATGATLVWRRHARLHVTVVVKATFALVPGGVMTIMPPEPIAGDEQESAAGLRAAGDLVPFRNQAEVLITGHAFVPTSASGVSSASLPVRLSVIRGGAAVLDKSHTLQVPAGTPAGRVRLFGFGPLSRHWPIRRRLLGEHDPRRFEGAAIDLPPDFDEAYFQAAPIDQRLDRLHGDEQIVFDGARPDGAPIAARLPGVHAVARLHGPSLEPGGAPLHAHLDTLHVDLDSWVCNVTWRAITTVASPDELASMHVVAAVERSGRSLPAPPIAALPFGSTMYLSPEEMGIDVAEPPPRGAPNDLGATRATEDLDDEAIAASSTALPFAAGPAPEAPSRWSRPPPQAGLTTGTLGLSVDDDVEVAARPAVPFPGAIPNLPIPPSAPLFVAVLPALPAVAFVAPPIAKAFSTPVFSPPEPAPRDADISLERCAAIAAELAERRAPRAAVLEAAGVGEVAWSGAERLWSQVVDRDVGLGHHELRDAYDTAYVIAWEKNRGPLGPADYARLRAAGPTRLGAALDAAGVRRTVWPRIQRVWKRRLEQDPTLAEAVAEAARALGPTR